MSAPSSAFEDWLLRHAPRYVTGEVARIGDIVDFGFDGKFSNGPSIDLMGQPWDGKVVRLDGLDAIVDTNLNSLQRYPIEALKFLGRPPKAMQDTCQDHCPYGTACDCQELHGPDARKRVVES